MQKEGHIGPISILIALSLTPRTGRKCQFRDFDFFHNLATSLFGWLQWLPSGRDWLGLVWAEDPVTYVGLVHFQMRCDAYEE